MGDLAYIGIGALHPPGAPRGSSGAAKTTQRKILNLIEPLHNASFR